MSYFVSRNRPRHLWQAQTPNEPSRSGTARDSAGGRVHAAAHDLRSVPARQRTGAAGSASTCWRPPASKVYPLRHVRTAMLWTNAPDCGRVASTSAVTAGSVMSCPLTLVTRSNRSAAIQLGQGSSATSTAPCTIVADPALAEPLAGIPELLGELARRYKCRCRPGRPVAFLAARLPARSCSWIRSRNRANPALGPQVTALAREVAAATGLVVRAGRKSVELLPPVRARTRARSLPSGPPRRRRMLSR